MEFEELFQNGYSITKSFMPILFIGTLPYASSKLEDLLRFEIYFKLQMGSYPVAVQTILLFTHRSVTVIFKCDEPTICRKNATD
jgi:hypothetical protein